MSRCAPSRVMHEIWKCAPGGLGYEGSTNGLFCKSPGDKILNSRRRIGDQFHAVQGNLIPPFEDNRSKSIFTMFNLLVSTQEWKPENGFERRMLSRCLSATYLASAILPDAGGSVEGEDE